MDGYGLSAPECFPIDDLLDFSNDDLFSASTTTDHHHHLTSSNNTSISGGGGNAPNLNQSTDFTDDLCVPSDVVAELEWLSDFVDDSLWFSNNFVDESFAGTVNLSPETSFHGRSRSKRSRASSINKRWPSSPESETPMIAESKAFTKKRESSSSSSSSESSQVEVARRCTHCASEKTPQWRTGPLGPKTLCNACGVRFKSGRLVPEYRPAASPTFVLTQHSNSHRKVMELRRQKEMLRQGQQEEEQQQHHHHHHQQLFRHQHNFEVC